MMISIHYWFIFDLNSLLQKNNLSTIKVIFFDSIGYSIGVYDFILPKSSFEIFYVPKELSLYGIPLSFMKYPRLSMSELIFAVN